MDYKESLQAQHKAIMKNNLLLHVAEYGYYKTAEGAAAMCDEKNEKFFKKQADETMNLIRSYLEKI